MAMSQLANGIHIADLGLFKPITCETIATVLKRACEHSQNATQSTKSDANSNNGIADMNDTSDIEEDKGKVSSACHCVNDHQKKLASFENMTKDLKIIYELAKDCVKDTDTLGLTDAPVSENSDKSEDTNTTDIREKLYKSGDMGYTLRRVNDDVEIDSEEKCLDDLVDNVEDTVDSNELFVVNTVLEHDLKPQSFSTSYGLALRHCSIGIDADSSIMSYEMRFAWHVQEELSVEKCIDQFEDALNHCLTKLVNIGNKSDRESCDSSSLDTRMVKVHCSSEMVEASKQCYMVKPIGNVTLSHTYQKDWNESKVLNSDNGTALVKNIGEVYCVKSSARGHSTQETDDMEENECVQKLIFSLNLSKMLSLLYNIQDNRLLWTTDVRVLAKLQKLSCRIWMSASTNPEDVSSFSELVVKVLDGGTDVHEQCEQEPIDDIVKPVSLYPMKFVHDMSFWENKQEPFNQLVFHSVIRDVAADSIVSVELIDIYKETSTGRNSRCYRLTLQSVDKSFSYDTSWQLQSVIRLEVQKQMGIVLR